MTGVTLDRWMVDELSLELDDAGVVVLSEQSTLALAAALRADGRSVGAIVRSLIDEHETRPAFEMRTGGWRIDLPSATARMVVAGSLTALALRDLGLRSLPAVALSAIGAALFAIERIEVNPSDLALHALLRQADDTTRSVADLYEQLPRHVREEVSTAQLADVVDRLTDAGLTAWDERGLLVRRPRSTRLVLARGGSAPKGALLDQLVSELHPDGRRDRSERVFVVHGRDLVFRDRFFELLVALGVRPLEWEPLVAELDLSSPMVLDVVGEGISTRQAQAVVVLMTPDDVVTLHPALRGPREDAHEIVPTLQPRPNVLIELGRAFALFPKSTIVVAVGTQRPIGDLAGVNVIRFDRTREKIDKVANRLAVAGCPVDDETARDGLIDLFAGLEAFDREPPSDGDD